MALPTADPVGCLLGAVVAAVDRGEHGDTPVREVVAVSIAKAGFGYVDIPLAAVTANNERVAVALERLV